MLRTTLPASAGTSLDEACCTRRRTTAATKLGFAALWLMVAAGILFGAPAVFAAPLPKVTICHIPPGNPDNWHTITISMNALQTHLDRHGDFLGACNDACAILCDDGDACTIDDTGDCENGCPAPEPVNCDDSNLCTLDECDPANGCVNSDIACPDDGDLCTNDMCMPAMGCIYPDVPCSPGEFCDSSTGLCDDPCDGVVCEPLDQCHAPGECSVNPAGQPECSPSLPLPDGTGCDAGGIPGTCEAGVCEQEFCLDPGICDDGNECTDDACDPQTGDCTNDAVPQGHQCDDGDPGTSNDACDGAGLCIGEPDFCPNPACDDANECTFDDCDELGNQCINTPEPQGHPCDADGEPGICDTGVCVPDAVVCDDDCGGANPDCAGESCVPGEDDGTAGFCDQDGECVPDCLSLFLGDDCPGICEGEDCDFSLGVCTDGVCE